MVRTVALGLALGVSLCGFAAADTPTPPEPNKANKVHLSCTGAKNEIRVVVTQVKKSVGLLTIELYKNNEATFLSAEGREVRKQFAARAPRTEVCLHAPESTKYAVAVYHDRNANQRFDKGPFGLPAEPYGVSNNPAMRVAPPKIEEALFDVAPEGATVEIDLRN